jgi:hypothetical protein
MRTLAARHDSSRTDASSSAPAARRVDPVARMQRAVGNAAMQRVLAEAESGTRGAGVALPYAETIQRSFGHHDVSGIRAHVGPRAAEASHAIGARAYTIGDSVAFGVAPDLRIAAHEAAHVVQQRGGVSLDGGVGHHADPYEQHADAVADRVVHGLPAADLLDRHAGGGGSGHRAVQRYAFYGDTQVAKDPATQDADMQALASDTTVRQYADAAEFKNHAAKKTDYLGNLPDGTWLRFSPTGTNLLGENHTQVTLDMVLPLVGSKSFIYEPLSSDAMTAGSAFSTAYETENAPLLKTFGVDTVKDKQPFGAESLIPKMGYGLNLALPYFDGTDPVKFPLSDLETGHYVGQPVQRYLKIAWGYSKDNKALVAQKGKDNAAALASMQAITGNSTLFDILTSTQSLELLLLGLTWVMTLNTPAAEALAKVHAAVEDKLDPFLTALPVDGYIGDELKKPQHADKPALLATFAKAFTELMVEMAAIEPGSRLPQAERTALITGKKTTTRDEKKKLFSEWRDFMFEDNVKAAAARGVRYAGMGQNHLTHLVSIGLDKPPYYPFEMDGKDITAFRATTARLKALAKP